MKPAKSQRCLAVGGWKYDQIIAFLPENLGPSHATHIGFGLQVRLLPLGNSVEGPVQPRSPWRAHPKAPFTPFQSRIGSQPPLIWPDWVQTPNLFGAPNPGRWTLPGSPFHPSLQSIPSAPRRGGRGDRLQPASCGRTAEGGRG